MAADIELRLVSKAIRERNLAPLLELGVTDEWWFGDEALQIWRYARGHYERYGECPTAVAVKDALPGYRLLKVEDSFDFLMDTWIGYRRRDQAVEMLQEAADLVEAGDHEAAITLVSAELVKLTNDTATVNRDRNVVEATGGIVDRYMELRDLEGGMRGLPTGFPTIDRATSGLQNQQLITIIAPPKCGKSTLTLAIGRNVHRMVDKPVLVVSFEMSNDEQESRYIAMTGAVSHTSLMTGQLSTKEERQLRSRLKETEGKSPFTMSDAPSNQTVSGLTAKVEKYQPAVLFVDGVYLMRDEVTGESGTPQALTNLTRSLKRLAQRFDIPVVISTQVLLWKMRKGQVEADGIGYSSSFYQDSDVILGLQNDSEGDDGKRELKVVASRNCPRVQTVLDWDWRHTTFTELDEVGALASPDAGFDEDEDEVA